MIQIYTRLNKLTIFKNYVPLNFLAVYVKFELQRHTVME
jgi:hypothetical protein